MTRKYDLHLLDLLKQREIKKDYMGAELRIKRVPDCDEEGCMDTRLYEDSKKMMRLLTFMPSKMMKMDTSEKGLANLRETFNGIKSIPVVEENITCKQLSVKADDGYDIPLYLYTQVKTTDTLPVLFYIHGGGFFGGHHGVVEESLRLMCEKFAFPIFSIDYRLAPENPYPIGHKDCYTALKWVYEHADELNINKNAIFVAGDSAGGNLAQYCSTRDQEENGSIVKGQMLLYPTLNMLGIEDKYFHWSIDHYQMTKKQRRALTKMLMMFGGMTNGMEAILKTDDIHNDYLNPYTKDPKKNPPTFISVGEHDYLKVESIAYAAKLHDANIPVETVIYNGMGHAYFDNTGVYPQCEDCIEEMGNFMLKYSK
ncbi:MAG: alpha/beta hydrolase [Traorella sp.]